MSPLPPSSMTLHGGCLCAAIRYTIDVPPAASRPAAPFAAPTPVAGPNGQIQQTTTLLPIIEIDHCHSCSLATGSIIQSWFVCPESWVSWKLLPRSAVAEASHAAPVARPTENEYGANFTTAQVVRPSETLCKETYLALFVSSENVHRNFCARCGTTLTYCYIGEKPNWPLPERNFDVSLGTLDREFLEYVRPDRHGWWSDGVGWVKEMVRNGDHANGVRMVRHVTGAPRTVMRDDEP